MAPSSLEHDIQKIFRNVDQLWNDLLDQYDRICNSINHLGLPATPLPLAVSIYLRDPMKKLHHALSEVGKTIRDILDHDMPIISLVRASGNWVRVERAAATIHREVNPTTRSDRNDDLSTWHGKAAGGYHARVPNQVAAVAEVKSLAGSTQKWLDSVASANLKFIAAICNDLGDMIAIAASAAVDISEMDLPEAAANIGKLVGNLAGKMIPKVAFSALSQMLEDVTKSHQLSHAQNQQELVLSGAWPKAVATG